MAGPKLRMVRQVNIRSQALYIAVLRNASTFEICKLNEVGGELFLLYYFMQVHKSPPS